MAEAIKGFVGLPAVGAEPLTKSLVARRASNRNETWIFRGKKQPNVARNVLYLHTESHR